MKAKLLPEHLGQTFGIDAAQRAGVSRSRLRGADLTIPVRGTRRRTSDIDEAEQAVIALALAVGTRLSPDAFFGGRTAAVLWSAQLPGRILTPDVVDVCTLTPRRNPRGKGIRGHECAPHLVHVVEHPEFGVRLASPASTWGMLAATLHNPYDLVAAGDSLVRTPQHPDDPPARTTIASLEAVVDAGRRVGVGRLRLALPRVRVGSSSRPETWGRLVLVDDGLPEPELAHEVRDPDGTLVARVDLAYPHAKIAIEYEGEHHFRDPNQWRADVERYERLAQRGWRVIRVTKELLFEHPGVLCARVRRALAAA